MFYVAYLQGGQHRASLTINVMAQRRMMSDKVIKTDAFMEMPHSTKNLYFYLMIEADDDGFVANPRTVMRMVNAAEDDYKILVGKKFIIPFESGVCVIKHWLIHNLIRADRKIDTQWTEEMSCIEVDKQTGKYSLNQGLQPSDNQVTTKCPHRLGKVRIGKENTVEESTPKVSFGVMSNVLLLDEEYTKLCERYGRSATNTLIEELSTYIPNAKTKYKDHYATLLNWAKRKGTPEVKKVEVNQSVKEASEVTPEQMKANQERLAKMRGSLTEQFRS